MCGDAKKLNTLFERHQIQVRQVDLETTLGNMIDSSGQ
jgi:hypothetical protein